MSDRSLHSSFEKNYKSVIDFTWIYCLLGEVSNVRVIKEISKLVSFFLFVFGEDSFVNEV